MAEHYKRTLAMDVPQSSLFLLLSALHLAYISGSPVSVDVGMCRPYCRDAARTSKETGQKKEYTKHSSMLEFLTSKKVREHGPPASDHRDTLGHGPSCGVNRVCEPTGMRVEHLLLFEGPRDVEVIQECHCETKLSQCVRVPSLKTYFFETPYETVIDVGGCSMSKGAPEGFSCVATKFKSALVDTPNKMDLIQTVAACELKENCYRVPYVEYYYEIANHTDGVKEERIKEIDVGRCLGGCTTGTQCLLRNPSDPEICHLWGHRQSHFCVPQDYESHTFLNHHGHIRTILSITSCVCQS